MRARPFGSIPRFLYAFFLAVILITGWGKVANADGFTLTITPTTDYSYVNGVVGITYYDSNNQYHFTFMNLNSLSYSDPELPGQPWYQSFYSGDGNVTKVTDYDTYQFVSTQYTPVLYTFIGYGVADSDLSKHLLVGGAASLSGAFDAIFPYPNPTNPNTNPPYAWYQRLFDYFSGNPNNPTDEDLHMFLGTYLYNGGVLLPSGAPFANNISGNLRNLYEFSDATLVGTVQLDLTGNIPTVPEPATLLLYGLGFAGAGLYRRMRRSK